MKLYYLLIFELNYGNIYFNGYIVFGVNDEEKKCK